MWPQTDAMLEKEKVALLLQIIFKIWFIQHLIGYRLQEEKVMSKNCLLSATKVQRLNIYIELNLLQDPSACRSHKYLT